MGIVAVYGLAGSDPGILAVAFPGVRVFRDPYLPKFVMERRLIVFSCNDELAEYSDKEVILIHPDATVLLDTKEGFLRFLGTLGVCATDDQVEVLLKMEDAEFWREVKQAVLMKSFPDIPEVREEKSRAAMYRLYNVLFEDFAAAFVEYTLLKEVALMSPMAVVSGLLSMTLRARDAHRRGDLNPYYKKLLLKNREFEPVFRRAMLEFLDSPKLERDFLTLILYCAERDPGDEADRFLGL